MKKTIICLIAALLVLCLAACGNNAQAKNAGTQAAAETQKGSAESTNPAEQETAQTEPKQEGSTPTEPEAPAEAASSETAAEPESEEPVPSSHSDVLVAYFSATGTTKGVAEKIAAITDADLYEITAAEPYSSDDLNYNDRNSRSTKEQNDKSARPEIGSEPLDLSGYKTVYLGFPIWWGEEPRIMDTFVESCSFDGITVIPFCTSSSSGIGRSGPNMEDLAGSGTWLDGKRFSGGVSEADLRSWIEGLK